MFRAGRGWIVAAGRALLPCAKPPPRDTRRALERPTARNPMRFTPVLAYALLPLLLLACSSVEVHHAPIEPFAAGGYRYYTWRTDPLPARSTSSDPLYTLDPIVRRDVDALLQGKGYVLDATRAQFTVDYQSMADMRQGARSQLADNITAWPSVTPNRRTDQAAVDNAIALSGVQSTNNLILQFNDKATNREVWQVTLTRIVKNANDVGASGLDDNLASSLQRALEPLPPAAQP
jgi:hypothetical protein